MNIAGNTGNTNTKTNINSKWGDYMEPLNDQPYLVILSDKISF